MGFYIFFCNIEIVPIAARLKPLTEGKNVGAIDTAISK